MLFVRAAYESPQVERIELVPHLTIRDPLLQHIVLLQRRTAVSMASTRCYARLL
jgi:hypothetical protein